MLRQITNTFHRTYDRQGQFIYICFVLACAVFSTIYAVMQRIMNSNYVLLVLCGGFTKKNDFAILFSIWIIPSLAAAFLNGTTVSRERIVYRYIASRYGNSHTWLLHEIINLFLCSIQNSLLLILLGMLSCSINGKLSYCALNPSLLNHEIASFQYWTTDKYIIIELVVMTILRFTRIGLITFFSGMLPIHPAQVGITIVLLIEFLSFIHINGRTVLFTYFSASLAGIPLTVAFAYDLAGLFWIIGIGSLLFSNAIQNNQI